MGKPPAAKPVFARPLADLIGDAIAPALAAQGFAGREIVARWGDLVGERLATRSRPLRIDWPKRRGGAGEQADPATLVILVESAFAPELQHAQPLILSRLNAHLGWAAVGRIVLKHGPVAGTKQVSLSPPEPDAAARAEVVHAAERVEDDAVRAALTRLGLAVKRAARPTS
jgi:hypothetical protein